MAADEEEEFNGRKPLVKSLGAPWEGAAHAITNLHEGGEMKAILCKAMTGLCVVAALAVCTVAQSAEQKEKPRLYTYVSNWAIPRARWEDMDKANAANQKILDAALANSTILGYGDDEILVHQLDGLTHVNWWVATSEAALLDVLDQFYKSRTAVASPVLQSATKHWDNIFVSQYYAWRAGTVKGGYVHGASYKLKADAPSNAVEILSKSLIVPLLEKLMADGSVTAYQVAEEAIHTADPSLFFIFFISPNAAGLDKVNAALRASLSENALASPAFGSMVDFTEHRDQLGRVNATLR